MQSGIGTVRNPALTKEQVKQAIYSDLSKRYTLSPEFFNSVWSKVESTGIVDKIIEKVSPKASPFANLSLQELEDMVSEDAPKNNALALEMIKRPNFNRDLVNAIYNGLGVAVKMGAEGTYGKGIQLKRQLNLQQFYTSSNVSELIAKFLDIGPFVRIYDPTCGSGRLFFNMPNQEMIHGVEIESDAYDIAKALYPKAQIVQDDTMLHMHENAFDVIVANPPFTLFWEDKARLFKHAGYSNRIVSEMAVLEISMRSLKDEGWIAIVMPTDVWINKFMDKQQFIDYMKQTVSCIAKIDLPSNTHVATEWGVSLYIFHKTSAYKRGWKSEWGKKQADSNLPEWLFSYKLDSFERVKLDELVSAFENNEYYSLIRNWNHNIGNQGPYKMVIAERKAFVQADYLVSASEIKSKDIVELDTEFTTLDSFVLPPLTMIPNGIHADLKTHALKSKYGTQWSPSRKAYVDLFAEIVTLDGFLDERRTYDELPLVNGLHAYDCNIIHTDGFKNALLKRRDWIEFQNTPFEIWIDEQNNFNFQELFNQQGYEHAYPEIWNKWTAKFQQMQRDPKYVTFNPFLKRDANWIESLFEFQKEDVMRLAMKASAIHGGEMGLGKTRTAIATGELKGFDHNLIVCQTRLINTWQEEFKELGMESPYLVEYEDDIEDMLSHRYVICSYETLRSQEGKKRPKSQRKANPGGNEYNYDIPSRLQTEIDIEDMQATLGFEPDELTAPNQPILVSNPKQLSEGEETKAMLEAKKLANMTLFADHFTEKFDFMIVDEAHNLSNPTTLQTQAVMRLKPKHLLFLTGTPIKNRVKGLLSLLIIGWGEDTTAMPYTKGSFLEHFMQEIEVSYETADSHGYTKTKTKMVEIPQIANPDDLRTLMASKWLRRTKYEPDVARDRKFPKPTINFIEIEPSMEEKKYAKQWYDELLRLKKEIQAAKEELKALRDSKKSGYSWSEDQQAVLDETEAQLRVKVAIFVVMIGKLRAVALAPQIDWLGDKTADEETQGENIDDDEEPKERKKTAIRDVIHIAEPYRGSHLTPRQMNIIDELKRRVKLGEQCYTIVDFPSFNRVILQPALEKAGIRTAVIDGAVGKNRRNEIISNFRKGDVDVICATIGTFDVGINIPTASYCAIIMPTWNWSDMEQAYSRMIRPQSVGTRTVDIYFAKNTIEDYVRQLVEMKRFNQEYVIDYGPRPPDQEWFKWTDAVESMFKDMQEGTFSVL